eukprot:TRINITY_DN12086_c0_g1_i1.p1 TRINITY_DN12086_c0_g1~~TRINITY_DN12086_c0_g1_i1.p1  ORF type:complete len:831 (-),score=247.19 TRINITY_DN12086_c0_g1_i1:35-2527(-)
MKRSYVQDVFNTLPIRDNIRNISVIAHVDHGKTTLVDSLLAKAGFIKEEDAGKLRVMDTKEEEQERQITMKSTGISLLFNEGDERYLVNLVDSPGHVDFSSEVTAALRITDGALIVVDCISGVCVQTETVTRQALGERIKPVLHLNKIDRAILEKKYEAEEMYQTLRSVVESTNVILAVYEDEVLGDVTVDPVAGTVSFGSGKQGWAFTLPQVATMVVKKMGGDYDRVLSKLWGNNYFDAKANKFTKKATSKDGKTLDRFICRVFFKQLIRLFNTVIFEWNEEKFNKIIEGLGVTLTNTEKNLRDQDLLCRVMQKWLPAADALVGMIVKHLPSPITAQRYRVENLYTGPLDDECAEAIRNCDPDGPLMVYISKMVPSSDLKRFYAYGRVFSGTVATGQKVHILGPDYVQGGKAEHWKKSVPRTVLMMGKFIENIDSVPCGNTVGIVGIDDVLLKSGTVTSSEVAHSIAPMKFSVSPVVRRALIPKNISKLPSFVKALRRLSKTDQCLKVDIKEDQYVIAGAGELHVEVALNDLRELLGDDCDFTVGQPIVEFCETVTTISNTFLSSSPNNHNKIYLNCEPLSTKLTEDLENEVLDTRNLKDLARILADDYEWDINDAKKIWYFVGSTVVVDRTRGVQYLNEIKDHVRAALNWVSDGAALAQEPMRGIRFNILEAKLHADSIHRGAGQITPCARKAFLAAQLDGTPRLMEPVFLAEILVSDISTVGSVYGALSQRRGFVFEEYQKEGSPLYVMKAHLPVLESFGFASSLAEATGGTAIPQLVFSHYQHLNEDPFEEGSVAHELCISTRIRKNIKAEIQTYDGVINAGQQFQ